VIVHPGEKARLVAFVEREPILGLGTDLARVRVTFHVGGQEVGDKKTDDEGWAETKCRVPAGSDRYEACAQALQQELRATGRLFQWGDERVVIAVDVDHTIAQTDYEELLVERGEDGSDPVKRSAQTLRALAQDHHILYLTSRPRSLLDKTRTWLGERAFPDGPVMTAASVKQTLRPGNFKEKKLHTLRKDWPTLLIGIGNEPGDAEAYGANEMLALVLPGKGERNFGRHAIVFRDWKALARFFEVNRDTLADAAALREVIAGKRMLARPVPPYEKR
jgi:phosphatidate phosphatase APP1